MKYINQLLSLLLVAFVATACDPDAEDYTAAGPVEGNGVYFAPNITTDYVVEVTEGEFAVDVMRSNSEEAATVAVIAEYGEGAANVFSVPGSVDFAAGENTASLTVSYANLEPDATYTVTLSFDDGTPYATTTSATFSVHNLVESWEVVSTEAVLIDNMFSLFGMTNLSITDITVEKEANSNQYRFRSPYNNEYFEYINGAPLFADDSNLPYIVLDGETYPDAGYYIAPTALGFVMVNGVGPSEDRSWNTFGSVAGNLSTGDGPIEPGNPTYPLGSYDESKKMFDFGSCYFNIDDYGYAVLNSGSFTLYLDPSLMAADYDRDYTWVDVPEAAGLFTSELAGGSWIQAVQVAEEDSTFYRLPYLYSNAEKAHLYFYLDEEGAVTIPAGQSWLGITSFGKTVWAEGVANASSFDAETGTLTLALNFYLADADGNKEYELAQYNETLLWGQTSEFVEGTTIDDYVGDWVVTFDDGQGGGGQSLVTIAKEDEATLRVNGLSAMDPASYDDSMFLDYIAENGQVSFSFQQVASIDGYLGFVAPFSSADGMISTEDALVGGLTRNGSLKFVDAPTNQGTYDSMVYLVSPDGSQIGFMTGYWNYLEWTPYTEAPATRAANSYKEPLTTFRPVKQGFVPRRTYNKTELNLTPQPVSSKRANMSVEGKSSVVFKAVK